QQVALMVEGNPDDLGLMAFQEEVAPPCPWPPETDVGIAAGDRQLSTIRAPGQTARPPELLQLIQQGPRDRIADLNAARFPGGQGQPAAGGVKGNVVYRGHASQLLFLAGCNLVKH